MGSLFNVVIPIRSHELRLRLTENDILNASATKVKAPEANNKAAVLQTLNAPKSQITLDESESTTTGLLAKDIALPMGKQRVFAYTLETKRGPLLLQISRDSMKLTRLGDASRPPPHHKKASTSSSHSFDAESVASDDGSAKARPRRGSSSSSHSDEDAVTEVIDSLFLEKHLEDVLLEFGLLSASWETSIDKKYTRILFTVDSAKADKIISHLHALGVGKKYESSLSVCATTVFTQPAVHIQSVKKSGDSVASSSSETEIDAVNKSKWNSFVESIKARLTVAQVVQNVQANAIMTFDFIVMLIVAAIIASIGLLESSPVNLIASMLVSPLMGPIMAFTFGAMIRDTSLVKTGLYVELCGLFMCLVVGFIFGIFLQLKLYKGPWANADPWPTVEMSARGYYGALVIGAAIAIPSGAGVALSILAGNAGSLVGVAISASLLPPCVNCGIFYGLALVLSIQETMGGRNPFKISCGEFLGSPNEQEHMKNHLNRYCNNALIEYAVRGSISLSLTLLNIILIFITGIIVLKIKEVAPYTTRHAYERFWKHDLKQARDYNKTHMGEDSLLHDLAGDPQILEEVDEDQVFNQVRNGGMYRQENVIANVKEKISRPALQHVKSKAPIGLRQHYPSRRGVV